MHVKRNSWKKKLAAMLAITLIGGSVNFPYFAEKYQVLAAERTVLKNPRIVRDREMAAGQNVTWDSIYFGSYPQKEVVRDEASYEAIDDSYSNFSTDAIEDTDLFEKLENSDGWDSKNEITLHGEKYRRMKKSDATKYEDYESDRYYKWKDSDNWHYFKYEPIKWRVLKIDGTQALLLADRVLDNQRYHEMGNNGNWEKSSIRSWLNGYEQNGAKIDYREKNFINDAFSAEERTAIVTTTLEDGQNTKDRIFLLSWKEVDWSKQALSLGFINDDRIEDEAKKCKSTTYAKAMGSFSSQWEGSVGKCSWWLRSTGEDEETDYVQSSGSGGCSEIMDSSDDVGVRPAINLNIAASGVWKYAGEVTSKTNVECKTEQGLKYDYDVEENYIMITGYAGREKSLTIPDTINGVKVKGFRSEAFEDCKTLESVRIAANIKKLENGVFSGCSNLKNVELPESVTELEWNSFSDCSSLERIVLPEKIKKIGSGAFFRCSNLNSIELPENLTQIGAMAFTDCSNLKDITLPDSITGIGDSIFSGCSSLERITLPENLVNISMGAFSECSSLKKIILPDKVESIGWQAFKDCSSLEELEIPESVKTVGSALVAGCKNLKKLTVADGNPLFDSRNNCNAIIETKENKLIVAIKDTIIPDDIESIGSEAFESCTGLTSIKLPDSVTTIEYEAFAGCEELKNIILPENLTEIGDEAFSGCENLEKIEVAEDNPVYDSRDNCNALIESNTNTLLKGCKNTKIPYGITTIAVEAFNGCSGLENITIPSSVTTIGDSAFAYCSNLKSVDLPSSVTTMDWRVFEGCSSLKNVTIPSGITTISVQTFSECSSLENITIPSSVTTIESGAFDYCSSLKSIDIPSSVTEIESQIFEDCNNLESICVAEDNKVYDSRENCNALIRSADNTLQEGCKNTKIPSSVVTIGERAFFNNSGITAIEVPVGVKIIKKEAFYSCTNLKTVKLSDSLEKIENECFEECTSLENIVIPSGIEDIEGETFANCTGLQKVTFPEELQNIYARAFQGCTNLKDIELPDTIEEIGSSAFEGCISLKNVRLPNTIWTVEDSAFEGCIGLETLDLPENAGMIGEHAFKDCENLTKITMPVYVSYRNMDYDGDDDEEDYPLSWKDPYYVCEIGEGAFLHCTKLKDIYYAGAKAEWEILKACIKRMDNENLLNALIHYGSTQPSGPQPVKPTPAPSNPPAQNNQNNQNNQTSAIKAGYTAKVGQAQYRVTATGTARTVEYQKPATKTQKTVKIPATVTINGEVYKVTSIAKNACKGNKKLKTVTISKNIKTIGANAFSGCKNLKTIRIASTSLTKKSVGKNAFKGIHKKAVIKVPKKKLKAYQKFLKGKGQAKSVKIKK